MQQRNQSLDFESLGDKHKKLEHIYAGQILIPGVPVIARLDGRAFHTLTKHANKPFDNSIVEAMQEAARYILVKFHPKIVYVQSDEISAVWDDLEMFDGNVLKMVSTMSSAVSVVFYEKIREEAPRLGFHLPTFDCRIWQVPDMETAAENLMWREMDATKNSISMVASCHFSPNQLQGKSTRERLVMLEANGIKWNELPHWLKKGAYFRKKKVLRELTLGELSSIPESHRPTGPIERSEVVMLEIPKATSMNNLKEVLFDGATAEVFQPIND